MPTSKAVSATTARPGLRFGFSDHSDDPQTIDVLTHTVKEQTSLIALARELNVPAREFQLLKYMMERNDKLLTRATLFKEVWNYKFTPESNLVDVHMGRLRRKVDGSNEPPMIRNVRGVGFVLSTTPFPQSSSRPTQQ